VLQAFCFDDMRAKVTCTMPRVIRAEALAFCLFGNVALNDWVGSSHATRVLAVEAPVDGNL
jgi:hypothetical protein